MRLEPRRCLIPILLDEREWSQRQLSEHTGIDEGTLSNYSTMRVRNMPLKNAILIADALGVTERSLYEWAHDE